MKLIKYSFLALAAVASLTSCLKSKSDFAGIRNDPGNIVTAITEAQYIRTDGQNIGNGYSTAFVNFSYLAPASEEVKVFTLHISQPRENKLSGNLVVKFAVTPLPSTPTGDYDNVLPIPANALTFADVTVPASSAASFDVPVKFTVNKALLDPNEAYGATVSISSVSQGVFSALESSVNLVFNYDPYYNESKYTGRYIWTSTLEDPLKQYGIVNNTKSVLFSEDAPNEMYIYDYLSGSTALFANNLTTGANTSIFSPVYVLDNTGKLISVLNGTGSAAISNLAVETGAPNQLVITSNGERKLEAKYSFTLTTTINGTPTPRKVIVTDKFEYDKMQVLYYPL